MINQTNKYKGFYIKQVEPREGSNSLFVGTLHGLRFTGRTRSELTDKIDRNTRLIADMASQSFASKGARANDDGLDYLLDNAETNAVIAWLTQGKLEKYEGAYHAANY
jgi:hypothetical protein